MKSSAANMAVNLKRLKNRMHSIKAIMAATFRGNLFIPSVRGRGIP